MVKVISVIEGDMLPAEKYKKLALLSKRLYGVSIRRYVGMKQEQKQLRRLQNRLEKTQDKQKRRELQMAISGLKQSIGWVLLESNQFKKALELFKTFSWGNNGEAKYAGMVRALINMEHLDGTSKLMARGLRRFPKSIPLLIAQGVFHQRSGNHITAINYFNLALEHDPRNEYALFDKTVSLGELGQDKKALAILRKLFKKYPGDTKISEHIERIEGKGEKK